MLTRIRNKKIISILPVLALFFIVGGAQALHPFFHSFHNHNDKNHTISSDCSELSAVGADQSTGSLGACPICNFLSGSSLLISTAPVLDSPLLPARQANTPYRLARNSHSDQGLYIRGPPV